MKKQTAMVFLVLAIFWEYSVLGTLIRRRRKPRTKDVATPIISVSSTLKTMLTKLVIRSG